MWNWFKNRMAAPEPRPELEVLDRFLSRLEQLSDEKLVSLTTISRDNSNWNTVIEMAIDQDKLAISHCHNDSVGHFTDFSINSTRFNFYDLRIRNLCERAQRVKQWTIEQERKRKAQEEKDREHQAITEVSRRIIDKL